MIERPRRESVLPGSAGGSIKNAPTLASLNSSVFDKLLVLNTPERKTLRGPPVDVVSAGGCLWQLAMS